MNKTILVAGAFLALGSAAFADTAYSSFDPGNTFNTGSGWTTSGMSSAIGHEYVCGETFVSATSGNVVQINIALGYVVGTNAATVSLYSDNAGELGSVLGSWNISDMGSFGSAYTPSSINIAGGPAISAGSSYWVVAKAADDAWLAWNQTLSGLTGTLYQSFDGAPGYFPNANQAAFSVETRPVPEPVSMVALASGALALMRRRRSK